MIIFIVLFSLCFKWISVHPLSFLSSFCKSRSIDLFLLKLSWTSKLHSAINPRVGCLYRLFLYLWFTSDIFKTKTKTDFNSIVFNMSKYLKFCTFRKLTDTRTLQVNKDKIIFIDEFVVKREIFIKKFVCYKEHVLQHNRCN